MKTCSLITLPHFGDERGKMSVLETGSALPFTPRRFFFIYDVPASQTRGNHANINTKFLMVAIHGSVEIEVDDGKERQSFILDNPSTGLFIDSGTWKVMKNFTTDAILLVVADTKYDKNEYITDYDTFLERMHS